MKRLAFATWSITLAAALVCASAVGASAAASKTTLSVTPPEAATAGRSLTLTATLVDAQGKPIADATIDFTADVSFLGATSNIVVGEGTTDEHGVATADWQPRLSGTVDVGARFAGDRAYAPAKGSASLSIASGGQLYSDQEGVQIPGVVVGPALGTNAQRWGWPNLNGWPIGAVLLVIWSLYVFVVLLLFRITREGPSSGAEAS